MTWVNDDIIMAFTTVIRSIYNENPNLRHQYHYMDTLFMTKLANDGDMDAYEYSGVSRWTRKIPGKNIFKLHKVFVPINSNNSHWPCIILDMPKQKATYYDSLHFSGDKYLRIIERYIRDEWENTSPDNLPSPPWVFSDNGTNTPYQGNG